MKYHLDTIPVWDAYHEETECPLCILEDKAEKSYIDSFLGGSVMEPDTRVEVNDKGFCPDHFILLYEAQNRLGLALMTHTYLRQTLDKFKTRCEKLLSDATQVQSSSFTSSITKKISGKKSGFDNSMDDITDWLLSHKNRCIICERINTNMERYAYTILHLWDKDADFKDVFLNSKGFCMKHLALALNISSKTLSQKKQGAWVKDIMPIQIRNMERLEGELLWFTQKFDYRNNDKPWGNSKDSLPRTLQKLIGKYTEERHDKD